MHMNPNYDHGRHPAGPNDIRLGRKMGQGCQLKYADFPKRITRNKFAAADKEAQDTCTALIQKCDQKQLRGNFDGNKRMSKIGIAYMRDTIYNPVK